MGTTHETDIVTQAKEQGDCSDVTPDRQGVTHRCPLIGVWANAVTKAIDETRLDNSPEDCSWLMMQVLSEDFFGSVTQNRRLFNF